MKYNKLRYSIQDTRHDVPNTILVEIDKVHALSSKSRKHLQADEIRHSILIYPVMSSPPDFGGIRVT